MRRELQRLTREQLLALAACPDRWRREDGRHVSQGSGSIPVDAVCPCCEGSGRCPNGCELGELLPEGERRWRNQRRAVREPDYENGCQACNMYGCCMGCHGDGRMRLEVDTLSMVWCEVRAGWDRYPREVLCRTRREGLAQALAEAIAEPVQGSLL
jgi:hypothetical protein